MPNNNGNGIEVIRDASLFVSEPNPLWFGNKPNPSRTDSAIGTSHNNNYSSSSSVTSSGGINQDNNHNKTAESKAAEGANWTNANWLKSRFHFNFAEFRHGASNFGPLRVCNDDLVQPRRGFGEHPHANAEIVTYVVDGFLTHQDSMKLAKRTSSASTSASPSAPSSSSSSSSSSLSSSSLASTGNANDRDDAQPFAETLTSGDIQFMTAGTGVRHSEHNLSDQPLRFIQMWFLPRQQGLKPNYGSRKGGDPANRRNQWEHLVTDALKDNDNNDDNGNDDDNDAGDGHADATATDDETTSAARHEPIKINQDVEMFVTDLTPGQSLPYHVKPGRQAYLLCLRGRDVALQEGVVVHQHDAAKVQGGVDLLVQTGAESGGSVLLIDVCKRV